MLNEIYILDKNFHNRILSHTEGYKVLSNSEIYISHKKDDVEVIKRTSFFYNNENYLYFNINLLKNKEFTFDLSHKSIMIRIDYTPSGEGDISRWKTMFNVWIDEDKLFSTDIFINQSFEISLVDKNITKVYLKNADLSVINFVLLAI